MNAEESVESLTREDLQAILRCNNEGSSGTTDELKLRVHKMFKSLPWKGLLTCVPKESIQRICGARGLRTDLSKDELIDQIVQSRPKPPTRGSPLRNLFNKWTRD
jgi:hypothetical protein